MFKKITVIVLALILVGAVGVGLYDAMTAQAQPIQVAPAQTANGRGGGQGQGWRGGQAETAGQAALNPTPGVPQSVPSSDWTVLGGVVQAVEVNGLSLTTDDGQPQWIQLGPNRFWNGAIAFTVGDHVLVTGFFENGQFMAANIANEATGQVFSLRSETGQPLWAGGNGNH